MKGGRCTFSLTPAEGRKYNFLNMSGKRILHRLAYTYLTLIGFFGRLLPRWLMLWLAVLIGNFYWAVMKHDREMVRRNLSRNPGKSIQSRANGPPVSMSVMPSTW